MIDKLSNPLTTHLLQYCDEPSLLNFGRTCNRYWQLLPGASAAWQQVISARLPEWAHLPTKAWGQIYKIQMAKGAALLRGIVTSTELDQLELRDATIVKVSYPWVVFTNGVGKIYNHNRRGSLVQLQLGIPFALDIFQLGIRIVQDHLICLGLDGLRVFDLELGNLLHHLNCPTRLPGTDETKLVFLDKHRCAAIYDHTAVHIFNWREGILLQSFDPHLPNITCLTIRHLETGPELIMGNTDGEVALLEPIDESAPRRFHAHDGNWRMIARMAMAGNQKLVTASLNECKIWDLRHLTPIRIIPNVGVMGLYHRVNRVFIAYKPMHIVNGIRSPWFFEGADKVEIVHAEDGEVARIKESGMPSGSEHVGWLNPLFRGDAIGNQYRLINARTRVVEWLPRLFDETTGDIVRQTPDEKMPESYFLQPLARGRTSLRLINLGSEQRLSTRSNLNARLARRLGLSRTETYIFLGWSMCATALVATCLAVNTLDLL